MNADHQPWGQPLFNKQTPSNALPEFLNHTSRYFEKTVPNTNTTSLLSDCLSCLLGGTMPQQHLIQARLHVLNTSGGVSHFNKILMPVDLHHGIAGDPRALAKKSFLQLLHPRTFLFSETHAEPLAFRNQCVYQGL